MLWRCLTFRNKTTNSRRHLIYFCSAFSSRKEVNMDDLSHITDAYKSVACNPSPLTALLRTSSDRDVVNIFSLWSIRDLIRNESTQFTKEFSLQCKSKQMKTLSSGIPSDVSSVSRWAFSKSGKRYAVFRKPQKSEESIFLEIWNLSQKECTFDMSDRKEHGKIHESGIFQSFEWSANEKYLLYISEEKRKKSESFFKDTFCEKSDEKSSEENTKGGENIYRESWGEKYASTHHSVLCILEIKTGKVEVLNLDDKYPNVSAAHATWGPNDEHIVFVGYKEVPFRLGLYCCFNRRSSIFSYNLETKNVECLIPEENVFVEQPVFSPNFENFLFLQNEAGGPHCSCKKLMKYDWKEKEISTVIDILEDEIGDEFAGVYIDYNLSSRWWSNDSRFFFFHTYRRSFLEMFYVDIFSAKVEKIPLDKSISACVLHDVQEPYILASGSSPNMLPHLIIGYFSHTENGINVIWNSVDENVCNELTDLSWSVHTLIPSLPNKFYPNLHPDILVLSSKEKKNGSLVVFPHGGPHCVSTAEFNATTCALARLGYTVCSVNYRGSIGFGENNIKSLPGNAGMQDVSDVVDAVEFFKNEKTFGIQNVLGFGGSHGGFLIAHLLGQYPNLLKAAVIRNPVIDISNMVGTSDIPDWCWNVTGCCENYVHSRAINPDILKQMWERSPIKYGEKVKSPTLLCLGKNDLRVPPSQGFQFYKLLKTQNVPTKVFYYDDDHGLAKPEVSSEVFVHTALWFQEHLS